MTSTKFFPTCRAGGSGAGGSGSGSELADRTRSQVTILDPHLASSLDDTISR